MGNFGLVFALFLGFDVRFLSIASVNREASVAIDSIAFAMSQMLWHSKWSRLVRSIAKALFMFTPYRCLVGFALRFFHHVLAVQHPLVKM